MKLETHKYLDEFLTILDHLDHTSSYTALVCQ